MTLTAETLEKLSITIDDMTIENVQVMSEFIKIKQEQRRQELYSKIEQAIIRYTIDNTQTAGELTREILNIIK
jgi:hypothetical protein